ncbi:FAD-dependent oxidoreductase [Actinoplanes derwentensis]|uniref:2-polyprenyl-6-methoxyphenol hydroxylase n=1 Tax=Actinoplanes derwentensis TaxID=113562 RepID=A0A1H1YPH3_9ACTN|nr:FAD-dependent oxidoreductase [Actinoplanes derwentensis]GID81231.1 FAD-binding monooxygenase [Actinoplanes derwentensis]SDT23281.1 2-polyprenyl-6-methoxyphenol hydroxylase [Actinoplanes derwentensis]
MTTSRALISGAGIAGLSTAFWLARAGWDVTVVERFDAFRDGGQNLDIRGTAREVLSRMGLEEAVRSRGTTEEGTAILDGAGRAVARFPVEDADGPTAELEILRGDLARIILDALPDTVAVRYGDHVRAVHDDGTAVDVTFAAGATERYDVLIIAEGVRSRTRELVFGSAVTRRELGVNMAYGTIPRIDGDDRWWRWYSTEGGRQITLRPDGVGTVRATLAFLDSVRNLAELPLDQAREALRDTFHDAGWQAGRVVDGFSTSSDVYVDYLTQIVMPSWSAGRVVVTGDSAWCVTPLGGGGTSLAMVGGYVLAAYLTQDGPAFARYEQWMRPLVDDAQKLPPGTPALFYPRSAAGVRALRLGARIGSTGALRRLTSRIGHVARSAQPLPEMRQASPASRGDLRCESNPNSPH